ncbi:MAG: hypothetical protein HY646_18840 [Acidobacteria bacterium]|nr:hypothetical protein [Acidobacteriota bacterium]
MNSSSGFKALPIHARTAVVFFGLAGAVAGTTAVAFQPEWHLLMTSVLVSLGVATACAKVTLTGSSSVSLLTCTVLLSVMVGGPGVAVLVAIAGVVAQTILPSRRCSWHQLIFNAGMIAVTASAASLTFHAVLGSDLSAVAAPFAGAVAAALVYFVGNSVSMALIIGLSKATPVWRVWRQHMVCTAPSFMVAGMTSILLLELVIDPRIGVTLAAVPLVYPIYYVSLKLR